MLTLAVFEESYQKLIGYFTQSDNQGELSIAKNDFFSNTGTLQKMKYFEDA